MIIVQVEEIPDSVSVAVSRLALVEPIPVSSANFEGEGSETKAKTASEDCNNAATSEFEQTANFTPISRHWHHYAFLQHLSNLAPGTHNGTSISDLHFADGAAKNKPHNSQPVPFPETGRQACHVWISDCRICLTVTSVSWLPWDILRLDWGEAMDLHSKVIRLNVDWGWCPEDIYKDGEFQPT